MDIKAEVKEESSFLNFSLQNEREFFMKDLAKKVKIETHTSSCNIKTELEHSTSSQNEEHNLLTFNETINESEIETKIDIKEEEWWLEREDSSIKDDIKDETQEDFYSTKPPSLYKGVSSYTSDLISSQDLGNDLSFNMNKDSPECGSGQNCQSQKHLVAGISSIETIVCAESYDHGKIVSMASPVKQGPHKCSSCKKAFTQLSQLRRHKLIHEGIRPHKCDFCNKAFTHSSNLKAHKIIHEGLKPHKCDICTKAYTGLTNLKTHKLTHDGIKPHKCNICNKAFTRFSGLKKHKLRHQGIKPHKCDICNKAFTVLSDLKRHKLIHEGIKPHKCSICNKAFTELPTLKRHIQIH